MATVTLHFICETGENPHRAQWTADYAGFSRAISVSYTPAFGERAKVLFRAPFIPSKERRRILAKRILDAPSTENFMFTKNGYDLAIDDGIESSGE